MKRKFISLFALTAALTYSGQASAQSDTHDWASATPTSPIDVTDLMKNPGFEGDGKGSNDGWKITTNDVGWRIEENNADDKKAGWNSKFRLDGWNYGAYPNGEASQEVSELHDGVYVISMLAASWNEYNYRQPQPGCFIFANADSVLVLPAKCTIVNAGGDHASCPKAIRQYITIPVSGGKLKTGIHFTKKNIGNLVYLDDVELSYLGSNTDALKALQDTLTASFNNEINGAGPFSTSYATAVKSALASISTSADAAAAVEATDKVRAAIVDLKANRSAWAALLAKYEEASHLENPSQTLADETSKVDQMRNDNEAQTSDIITETAKYSDIITYFYVNSSKGNKDITDHLQNADFASITATGFTNWTNTMPFNKNTNYQACQIQDNNFGLYQTITGLPTGIYRLDAPIAETVNYSKDLEDGYSDAKNQLQLVKAYISLNDSKVKALNYYDAASDTKIGTSVALKDGKYLPVYKDFKDVATWELDKTAPYTSKVFAVVNATNETGNSLKVQLGQDGDPTNIWTVFTKFGLTYVGKDVAAVAAALTDAQPVIDRLNNASISATAKKELNDAVKAAKAATANDAALAAFKTVTAKITAAYNSVDSFNTVLVAKAYLDTAIVKCPATSKNLEAAKTLSTEMATAIKNGSYTDEEIHTVSAEAYKKANSLKIDAGGATLEKPANVTSLIINPNFDPSMTSGFKCKGWNYVGNGANWGAAGQYSDFSKGVISIRVKEGAFSQTINGLDNGTYVLTVQGFNRSEYHANQKSWNDDAERANAVVTANDVQKYLPVLNEYPLTKEETEAYPYANKYAPLYTTVENGGYYICPNENTNSYDAYVKALDHFYWSTNKCVVNVPVFVKNGTLKIGVSVKGGDYWPQAAIKSFSLTYYGPDDNTKNTTSGVNSVNIEGSNVVISKKIYSITGIQQTSLQKGLNIVKEIMKDGKTKSYKILVK